MFELFNVYEDIRQLVRTTESFQRVFDILDGNNGFLQIYRDLLQIKSEDSKPEIQQDPQIRNDSKHKNDGVLKVTGGQQNHFLFPWKLQETGPEGAALHCTRSFHLKTKYEGYLFCQSTPPLAGNLILFELLPFRWSPVNRYYCIYRD